MNCAAGIRTQKDAVIGHDMATPMNDHKKQKANTHRHIRGTLFVLLLCLPGASLLAAGKAASPASRPARPMPTLTDKTLVAWLHLANRTQRAGAVLTIMDPEERFDAIVYGEVTPNRWMAGSNFFRRTHRAQQGWPAETAEADTLIQIAIVYRGRKVTILRNGKPYATYAIDKPQPFGPDASVLIGLRYLGHGGEIGPLAGTVDDARIYGVALTAEQVAALTPNRPSRPAPLAWWHFEDGKASDAMGTFPPGRLIGGAQIAGGKLHLDGKSGYLLARRPEKLDRRPQSMFYKAKSRQTGRMWDTWLYLHKGTYYLYYLAKAGPRWNNISMATSPDGVHWTEHGRILAKARGVTWMGTGSTWRSPNFAKDGKYQLNFSEWRGPRQTIFFAESTDLLNWTRLGKELEFVQDERWYEPRGRWDCIWTLPRPGGGFYGYWTATPKAGTGGRFGFGETLDGLRWKALAPPKVHGVGGGEVGAIEKIGRKYYMMFGHHPVMETLVADSPKGPFHVAKKNRVLLSGHTYFSRFLKTPGGVLVNHHAIARSGPVYLSPLKLAVLDRAGTLRLAWWPGNEAMKHEPVAIEAPKPHDGPGNPPAIAMCAAKLPAAGGVIVEGTLALPAKPRARRRGLYIECGAGQGSAILINAAGQAELGPMKADGTGFKAEKKADREMSFGTPARFRLLLAGSLLEFYVDDILIECFSLPADATGRIGFLTAGGRDVVGDLKAWR